MRVYHLELEVTFALEESIFYSNVYSTMERAIEEGKYHLEKNMINLYISGYQIKGQDNITTDELFSIERTDYTFKIIETDPKYADNFNTNLYGKDLWTTPPTHIEYYYNYKGEFEYKHIQWKIKQRIEREHITMYKEDLQEGAGTKFKIGDIVTVNSNCNKELTNNKIFVVRFLPRRVTGSNYFINTYGVTSTYNKDTNLGNGIFTFEYRESELKKYNGKIEKDSPIGVLQRILKRDIGVTNKVWQDLKNGKVSFDTKINYKKYLKQNICEFENDNWSFYSNVLTYKLTGLTVDIYPYKNINGINIKDYLPKIRIKNCSNDYFFLTLEEEPKVVIGECKLPKEELEQVRNFIKENLDILLKHFDHNNNFDDENLREELKRRKS